MERSPSEEISIEDSELSDSTLLTAVPDALFFTSSTKLSWNIPESSTAPILARVSSIHSLAGVS